MKKKSLIILFILSSSFACRDFNELEQNPNKPSNVPASLIFRGVEKDMFADQEPFKLEQRWGQFYCCNYNYYGTNEYWTRATFSYTTLKNVQQMEELVANLGTNGLNPYAALSKFFRAFFFIKMTMQVGDLPLDDALKGLEVTNPAYATQKEVFVQSLKWLDEANDDLAQLIASGDNTLDGDFYYNNDMMKWQKAVNTYQLRILINLSKKETDTDLNIKQRFQNIVNNSSKYPVFESIDDNMNFIYNGTSEIYPNNPGTRGFDKGRYNMAAGFLNLAASLHDPRTFIAANPAKAKIAAGVAPGDFSAYVGAPSGESLDDMTFKAGNGEYSFINQSRYYSSYSSHEPTPVISYWELCFNMAEAINRGWITGNAEDYYDKGIRASMELYGIEDGSAINITEPDNDDVLATVTASVTDYIAQPEVKYAGNNDTGLSQILTQKYLAYWQNGGLEAYYNFRRTGIPQFDQGPGTGNSGIIPRRWLYPESEVFYNSANLNTALQRQFGSTTDDVDNKLWIEQ
jgi:hypothetical protein